ncbi:MAG: nitroreductase [Pseudomonadales bacterium]|nr:nitroreductase [Pseudomonadales bacterium]
MTALSLADGIRGRHSIRGFLPRQVPQDLLNQVFELAQWSPSGTNIQPWQVYVASGAVRDELRAQIIAKVQANEPPQVDFSDRGKLGAVFRERRRGCARALYGALDVDWDDKPARAAVAFRNFEMFDAPHVAFLCMNAVFGPQAAADVGMYAQTLMLSMTAHGLASCAQGTMAHYPDLVRETFDMPAEVKVLFGISFGYEDTSDKVNQTRTDRASLAETVKFMGETT